MNRFCPSPSRPSRRSAASPIGIARALLAPEEWRISDAPGAPPSPRFAPSLLSPASGGELGWGWGEGQS